MSSGLDESVCQTREKLQMRKNRSRRQSNMVKDGSLPYQDAIVVK
jgi:hypothetical protein